MATTASMILTITIITGGMTTKRSITTNGRRENHQENKDFRKLNKDEQKQYWDWRHSHGDRLINTRTAYVGGGRCNFCRFSRYLWDRSRRSGSLAYTVGGRKVTKFSAEILCERLQFFSFSSFCLFIFLCGVY